MWWSSALVQIVQALLGPGVFRITPPTWLPRVPVLGRHVFEGGCVNCHEYNGDARQKVYASLAGSSSVGDPDGGNVTRIILNGAKYRIKDQIV
jgi:cytochrome c